MNLFASCRTLYHDAGSAFYSNNIFIIEDTSYHKFQDYGRFDWSIATSLPCALFTYLGTQAHWLRKLVLDTELLGHVSLHRSLKHWEEEEDGAPGRFDITPLMHTIWNMDLDIDISFVNTTNWTSYCSLKDRGFNLPAITAVFKSILGGQLQLRKYGQLLRAIAINRDASGGEISWGTTSPCCSESSPGRFGPIFPDRHYMSSFVAEDGGARLQMRKRETALNLLNLPPRILERIIALVVRPAEGFLIDLDRDTKFKCGIVHVNKDLYREWREPSLFGSYGFEHNRFELVLTTDRLHTDFDGFKKLRKLLRKTFVIDHPHPRYNYGLTTLIAGPHPRTRVNYTLKFEVQGPISLSDIRISILPFVMETATSNPREGPWLTIQVWSTDCDGAHTMTASHTFKLRELRINVLTALMKSVYLGSKKLVPEFWINGFGEVVQVEDVDDVEGEAWEIASDVLGMPENSSFHVLKLHPIDRQYQPKGIHPDCWANSKELFPFERDLSQIMAYLVYHIDDGYLFRRTIHPVEFQRWCPECEGDEDYHESERSTEEDIMA
ncbi:hypothetical protein ACET3X_007175 [Alternaria dauci]|uniref:F-box domain-containing protein n=1 Tax=Alternaria dauci TaxID=48095 RepID=A0ABR3UHQ6_9PLEO